MLSSKRIAFLVACVSLTTLVSVNSAYATTVQYVAPDPGYSKEVNISVTNGQVAVSGYQYTTNFYDQAELSYELHYYDGAVDHIINWWTNTPDYTVNGNYGNSTYGNSSWFPNILWTNLQNRSNGYYLKITNITSGSYGSFHGAGDIYL